MFVRRYGVFVAVLAAGLGCAACGSSPVVTPAAPVAPATSAAAPALTADQVATAAMTAAHGTSAVHARASVTEGSTAVKVDVQLNKDSAAGTLTLGDSAMPIRRIGSVYYVQLSDGVLASAGVSATTKPGSLMRGKWVSSNSQLGASIVNDDIKSFLNYDQYLTNTVGQLQSAQLTAGGNDTVDSVPVQVFRESDGSVADVASAAPHYLIRMADGTNEFDFSGWDQPTTVVAPSAAELYSGPGA